MRLCVVHEPQLMPGKRIVGARDPAGSAGRARRLEPIKVAQSTGYLVRRTYRAFTRSLEQRLAPHGVSLSMWFFLRLLWERDGLTQKELSDELGLNQATTVAAMDGMQTRGLVQRQRSTEDRRRTHIYLTRAGRALKDELLPYAHEVNRIAVSNLSAAELEQLWDVLDRINCSLDEDNARAAARVPAETGSQAHRPQRKRYDRSSRSARSPSVQLSSAATVPK